MSLLSNPILLVHTETALVGYKPVTFHLVPVLLHEGNRLQKQERKRVMSRGTGIHKQIILLSFLQILQSISYSNNVESAVLMSTKSTKKCIYVFIF